MYSVSFELGLRQFRSQGTLSYFLWSRGSREAWLIDPVTDLMGDYQDFVGEHGLRASRILETHHRPDRPSAASLLSSTWGLPVHRFQKEPEISLGGVPFQSVPLAGYTVDSVGISGAGLLFSGGAILIGGGEPLGRPSQDPRQRSATAERVLASLPPRTVILPSYDDRELLFSRIGTEQGGELDYDRALSELGVEKYFQKVKRPSEDQAYVDVREPSEYRSGHIPGTVNIPLSELALHYEELMEKSRIYFSCQSGRRSLMAAKTFARLGAPDVVNVAGGFLAWVQQGLPTETPSS